MTRRIPWLFFALLLSVIAVMALNACVLRLPILGVVLARCPTDLDLPVGSDPTSLLLREELAELERAVVTSPNCEVEESPPPFVDVPINEAEEIAIILDTSVSMKEWARAPDNPFSDEVLAVRKELTELDAEMRALGEPMEDESGESDRIQIPPENLAEAYRIDRRRIALLDGVGLTRWTISREAITSILESPPSEVPLGVWGFGNCGAPPRQLYPNGSRGPREVLDDLIPLSNTALAEAIDGVPDMVSDGVGESEERGANIVIFSDGLQSCPSTEDPADVCAAARRLKAMLPHVWLHVVALADELDSLRCVAEITGGVVVRADETARLSEILRYVAR